MVKRNKSIRAVEALEAVKKRIDIELDRIICESDWHGKDVREKVLEIIEEQLEKES